MMHEREVNGPFADFQDFCYRMDGNDMNKRAVENLIRAGAFDSMGTHRSQLIAVYEKVMERHRQRQPREHRGADGLLRHGRRKRAARAAASAGHSGIFRAGADGDGEGDHRSLSLRSPDGRLPGAVPPLGAAPIGRILEDFAQEAEPTSFADGQKLSIAGVVTSSKVKTTRSNTLMAYVTVEDSTGAMEMLCFARTLETSGSYLKEGQTILLQAA